MGTRFPTGYVLSFSPTTLSVPVHWLLIELKHRVGIEFTLRLVDFPSKAQKNPVYLALNPHGLVPTLAIDGVPYTECAALLTILGDRHPDARLAPTPDHPMRMKYTEIMFFLANTMLPAIRNWFYAESDGSVEGAKFHQELAVKRMEHGFNHLSRILSGQEYLIGEMSTLDILTAYIVRCSRKMPVNGLDWEELKGLVKRMTALQSWKELAEAEGLNDWPPEL